MDLNSILSQLGAGRKETVYLSVTPGVGLELIQLDINSRSVKNYAYRPLQYNESIREIADMGEFKDAVIGLFSELKINPKSNVVLNMPMILFGSKELPLLLGDEAVTEALTSEVEQSYVFRRYEPMISWVDASTQTAGDMRKLFYTAIQKSVVDDIRATLSEIGATLTGIEISTTSLLKALAYSKLTESQMQDNVSWNLMLVTQSGYSIISMLGKNIVDYYEEPLAIKSFEGDEIYNAINASAQITLMSYPANYLYIVSETDLVSAELVANRIQGTGTVGFWENNEFRKQEAIPVSLEILEETSKKISLEAIGIAAPVSMPVKFDFLEGTSKDIDDPDNQVLVEIGNFKFNISPNMARNITVVVVGILLIPFIIAYLIFPPMVGKQRTKLNQITLKVDKVNEEIKEFEGDNKASSNFNSDEEIKNVLTNNRTKLIGYSALGESVTKHLWITYFETQNDGKFDIKGESENVEDIYTFYRNMKDSLLNTKLRIHKLEMKTNSVDDAVNTSSASNYEFEVTNMTDAELAPPEQNNASEQQPTEKTENKSGKS